MRRNRTEEAAALGWRVLPVTVEMIEDGTAVALIRQALKLSGVEQ